MAAEAAIAAAPKDRTKSVAIFSPPNRGLPVAIPGIRSQLLQGADARRELSSRIVQLMRLHCVIPAHTPGAARFDCEIFEQH
jgi:hypothetical protein